MAITVGNTLTFELQYLVNGVVNTFPTYPALTVIRKEFDAKSFAGVGYQRILIKDNFGSLGNHGIGNDAVGTALQVETKSMALPLYRFDYSFCLDSERLKQVYELFLAMYNFRSEGFNVRLKMTDTRLRISEPVDSFGLITHARSGTDILDNLATQQQIQYQLKNADYYVAWENFEWVHKVGDLYSCNILGTELEIITDINSGNTCVGAEEETAQFIEGFTITELGLPSDLTSGIIDYDVFGVGIMDSTSITPGDYFGHFKVAGVDRFYVWDEAAPGVSGKQEIQYDTFDSEWRSDTGPINTLVMSNKLLILDSDPENYAHYVRQFLPNVDPNIPGPLLEVIEYRNFDIPLHVWASGVEKFQSWRHFDTGTAYLLPRLLRVDETPLTLTANSPVKEQFRLIDSERGEQSTELSVNRISIRDWTSLENGTKVLLTGDAANTTTGGIELVNPNLPLDNQRGGWIFTRKLNISSDTYIKIRFTASISDGIGGDGFAVVFHNDSRGASATGQGGLNMGFGGNDRVTGAYTAANAIQPSIAVAFDTFGNGPTFNEPATGASTPHNAYLIQDGDIVGGKLESESLASSIKTFSISSPLFTPKDFTIIIDGANDTIEVGAGSNSFTWTSRNLFDELGGEIFIGFTAGIDTASYEFFRIHSFNIQHDSTWNLADTNTQHVLEYATYQDNVDSFQDRNTVRAITNDDRIGDVKSVFSPTEGIWYHIGHERANPANAVVYQSTNPNAADSNNVVVFQSAANAIPQFTDVYAYTRSKKFYLTQGSNTGTVWVTTDWINYTNIGVWTSKSASVDNEGQLYAFRDLYLLRSPNRFVIDMVNDTFVDLQTLLCDTTLGTPEDLANFGPGREIVSVYSTPAFNLSYTANEEQIIICSRDIGTQQNLRCFKFTAETACP